MNFLKPVLVSMIAVALALVGSAAGMARGFSPTPMARTYNGSWPVTVTRSQHSNGTGCLTLTSNGSASLLMGSQTFSGSYVVFNHTFVATVTAQAYSQNAGLVYIGRADRTTIGNGVFEDVYGGADFDSGALAFGMKGGC
jgi:hypothetical protein